MLLHLNVLPRLQTLDCTTLQNNLKGVGNYPPLFVVGGDNLRLQTNVKVDKDSWEITHIYDEADILRLCKEARDSGKEGNLTTGEGKLIARIPRHRFFSDIELQLYQQYKGKDNVEADMWLNRWLAKYPEFKTTTGGRKGIL